MGRAEASGARHGTPYRAGRSGRRRFFTLRRLLGTFFGICLLGMAAFAVLYVVVDVPEGNAQATQQSNVYRWSDGTVLARTGQVNREIVDLGQVPKDVQHAFVAAENKSFYQDKGIDLRGTARGLLNTVRGRGKQGGSTITQQYVKNYYLNQDRTVSRKLKELVISLKVDQKKSKDEILAGYMNTSYYGRGAYGIQAAAQAYYRVDARDLDVAQGAYLAALLQAPNQYDWTNASAEGKRLVTERWHYVLRNMVDKHWLSAGEQRRQTFPVPEDPAAAPGLEGQTGYLVNAAKGALEDRLVAEGSTRADAEATVEAGGWNLTLNIDRTRQKQLEHAVKERLTSKLDPENRPVDADVQAGAASVDPRTGAVVALYGGRGYTEHYRDNALRTDYQPASTFKPLILAAALDQGAKTQDGRPITASTVYDGTSRRPVVGSDTAFAPPNEDDVDYGRVTVQKAMNKSINSVFAQMGVDVSMDRVLATAGKLGMDVKGLPAVPAQTLGTMGASPLEMAGVYATLDNHGRKVTPAVLKSAEHKDHAVSLPDPVGGQAVSRETADSVTSVLTGVVDDGTGYAVRDDRQPVAGKTGTSDCDKSAWFTGYTPKLVTSVGVFGEAAEAGGTGCDGTPVKQYAQVTLKGAGGGGRVNGGGFPAEIWAAYTFTANGTPTDFDLDTDMGAAVAPPPDPTRSEEPSTSPSSEPPSSAPPSEPPSSPPPATGPDPTGTPEQPPSSQAPDPEQPAVPQPDEDADVVPGLGRGGGLGGT